MFGPNITIGCPTCLSKYTLCIPLCTLFTQTWLSARSSESERCYYCNIFWPVNETWGNLAALHSILHQRHLSSYHWLALTERVRVFLRRRGFADRLCRGGGNLAFKANFVIDSFKSRDRRAGTGFDGALGKIFNFRPPTTKNFTLI